MVAFWIVLLVLLGWVGLMVLVAAAVMAVWAITQDRKPPSG
jgi:hypothetical protein